MNKIIMIFCLMAFLSSCASIGRRDKQDNIESTLDQAESSATVGGRKVLKVSRAMIANKEVHIGGCWDYINAVYDRAGYSSKSRETIFKSKFRGPYVNSNMIEVGDWLYFVNHTFRDSEHSAIFVAWVDEKNKEALMVNYVGGYKKKPGTYKRFILDKVYNIYRTQ